MVLLEKAPWLARRNRLPLHLRASSHAQDSSRNCLIFSQAIKKAGNETEDKKKHGLHGLALTCCRQDEGDRQMRAAMVSLEGQDIQQSASLQAPIRTLIIIILGCTIAYEAFRTKNQDSVT